MSTSKSMTQKEMFEHIMEAMSDDMEVVEFCECKIAQLSKPRARKTSAAVVEFREQVREFMEDTKTPMSCGEVASILSEKLETTISAQKVSAAFRFFVKEGILMEVETKKSEPNMYVIA